MNTGSAGMGTVGDGAAETKPSDENRKLTDGCRPIVGMAASGIRGDGDIYGSSA